jgi:hypothetical protein
MTYARRDPRQTRRTASPLSPDRGLAVRRCAGLSLSARVTPEAQAIAQVGNAIMTQRAAGEMAALYRDSFERVWASSAPFA